MADHGVDERVLLKWILKEIGQDGDWKDLFRDRTGHSILHSTRRRSVTNRTTGILDDITVKSLTFV